jgi:Ca-activated chloride channel family protein
VAIGLGSETGSKITLTDPATGAKTTLMDGDHPVISKLNGDELRKIALATEGAYIPAGTSAVDLESIMKTHVAPMVSAAVASAQRVIPAERYVWPLLAALIFLLAALWVGRTP